MSSFEEIVKQRLWCLLSAKPNGTARFSFATLMHLNLIIEMVIVGGLVGYLKSEIALWLRQGFAERVFSQS